MYLTQTKKSTKYGFLNKNRIKKVELSLLEWCMFVSDKDFQFFQKFFLFLMYFIFYLMPFIFVELTF